MALRGSLKEFPITDIISLVELQKQNGAAEIRSFYNGIPVYGRIYFKGGNIVCAELEDLPSEEALFTLFSLEEGDFEFQSGRPSPREDIKKPNSLLIISGLKWADEVKRIKLILPRNEIVLTPCETPPPKELILSPQEWRILCLVNNRNNINLISSAAKVDLFQTRKALAHLAGLNLIRVSRP